MGSNFNVDALSEWQEATATYATLIKKIKDALKQRKSDQFKTIDADSKVDDKAFVAALKKVEDADNFIDLLTAADDMWKPSEALIKSLNAVDKSVKAACESAGLKLPDCIGAAKTLQQAVGGCRDKVVAGVAGLQKSKLKKQRVATVKLLSSTALSALENLESGPLGDFLIEVEIELPSVILDDLVKGVEGVSLAKMQDIAETATAKIRGEAAKLVRDADQGYFEHMGDANKFLALTRVRLNKMADEAGDVAEAAIQAHWNTLANAHASLKTLNKNCAKKVTFGTVGLGASVTALVMSLGTAIPAYFKLVTSAADIFTGAKNYLRSADNAAEELLKVMRQLQKEMAAESTKWKDRKEKGAELISLLGAPFLKTCKSAEDLIDILAAKCAELDKEGKKLLKEAMDAMKVLKVIVKSAPDTLEKDVKKLENGTDTLLTAVERLLMVEVPYFQLIEDAKKTVAAYKQAKNVAWDTARQAVAWEKEAQAIGSVLDNLKNIAEVVRAAAPV